MNREIYPGGIYPLTGDVQSSAGHTGVSVTGLQGRSLTNPNLFGGEVVEYNVNTNRWEPTLRATVQVNGITVSTDGDVFVNLTKLIKVNGV